MGKPDAAFVSHQERSDQTRRIESGTQTRQGSFCLECDSSHLIISWDHPWWYEIALPLSHVLCNSLGKKRFYGTGDTGSSVFSMRSGQPVQRGMRAGVPGHGQAQGWSASSGMIPFGPVSYRSDPSAGIPSATGDAAASKHNMPSLLESAHLGDGGSSSLVSVRSNNRGGYGTIGGQVDSATSTTPIDAVSRYDHRFQPKNDFNAAKEAIWRPDSRGTQSSSPLAEPALGIPDMERRANEGIEGTIGPENGMKHGSTSAGRGASHSDEVDSLLLLRSAIKKPEEDVPRYPIPYGTSQYAPSFPQYPMVPDRGYFTGQMPDASYNRTAYGIPDSGRMRPFAPHGYQPMNPVQMHPLPMYSASPDGRAPSFASMASFSRSSLPPGYPNGFDRGIPEYPGYISNSNGFRRGGEYAPQQNFDVYPHPALHAAGQQITSEEAAYLSGHKSPRATDRFHELLNVDQQYRPAPRKRVARTGKSHRAPGTERDPRLSALPPTSVHRVRVLQEQSRQASQAENASEVIRNRTNWIGVSYVPRLRKYRSFIFHPVYRKTIGCGTHMTAYEAAKARHVAVAKLPHEVQAHISQDFVFDPRDDDAPHLPKSVFEVTTSDADKARNLATASNPLAPPAMEATVPMEPSGASSAVQKGNGETLDRAESADESVSEAEPTDFVDEDDEDAVDSVVLSSTEQQYVDSADRAMVRTEIGAPVKPKFDMDEAESGVEVKIHSAST